MSVVLVVEDNPYHQRLYQDELIAEGYQVRIADDGDAALAVVAHEPLDVVILDLHLRSMDSVTVLQRIRTINPRLPVIINTIDASGETLLADTGVDAFVVKSSDLTPLKTAIVRLLTQHQASHKTPARSHRGRRG